MLDRPVTHYFDNRQLEWAMSASLLTAGMAMLVWPIIAHGSILQVLVHSIGTAGVTITFIVIGLLGMAALVANGASVKTGPHIRSITAIVRAVIWTSFVLSMVQVSIEQGFPSPMVIWFAYIMLAELYTSYRAVLDVRNDH